MSKIIFTSPRCQYREFIETDFPAVHDYCSDKDVVRYMRWGPNSETETLTFLNRAINNQHQNPRLNYELAVVLSSDFQLIGTTGLHISSLSNREAWIATVLNRKFWSQGFAGEITRALFAFGFEELKLHRIYAYCDPDNVASEKTLKNVGLTFEGRLRENARCKGSWHDSLVYSCLEHEWLSLLGK